jgi:hypothetical protein
MPKELANSLKKLAGKQFAVLLPSANDCLKKVYALAKSLGRERVILADQGGWLTYKRLALKQQLIPVELRTDYGILNPADVAQKANDKSILVMNALAGFHAEQPIREIEKICAEKNCIFVNDATGIIGTENAKAGDIVLVSSGKGKPINAGYGGFIATDREEWAKAFGEQAFDDKKAGALRKALDGLEARRNAVNTACARIKKELEGFEIIHPASNGIVVIAKYRNEREKKKLIAYCKENRLPYKLCPREIRVLENAVSIEAKAMNFPANEENRNA